MCGYGASGEAGTGMPRFSNVRLLPLRLEKTYMSTCFHELKETQRTFTITKKGEMQTWRSEFVLPQEPL